MTRLWAIHYLCTSTEKSISILSNVYLYYRYVYCVSLFRVSLTAEFLKTYPSKGEFNTTLLDNAEVFGGLKCDLKRHLMRLADTSNGLVFVPVEAEFMTKTAFTSTYGNAAPSPKHFTLKQKPKSAILRAEALMKGRVATQTTIFLECSNAFSLFTESDSKFFVVASLPLAKSKPDGDNSLPMRFRDRFKPIDSIISKRILLVFHVSFTVGLW